MSEPLVLASRSPQRRAILEGAGIAFEVAAAGVDELGEGEPAAVALVNARRKADAVARRFPGRSVLGADTVVALGGRLHGQPDDEAHARRTLRALAGRTHAVVSAARLLAPGEDRDWVRETAVTFRRADSAAIDWYLARGEWRGRAGGYAIQQSGSALVERIEGDWLTVVGLPSEVLFELIRS